MGRVSSTYRQSCVVPPGGFDGPGSPTLPPDSGNNQGTGASPNGSCGTSTMGSNDPNNPSDPTNSNCTDPVFAAANPNVCGNPISLVLSPSIVSTPVGGTTQYSAFITQGGNNITVTEGLTFTSSNTAEATITSTGGLATAVAGGTVIITATWHGYTAQAQLTVNTASGGMGPPVGSLCNGVTTDIVVLIDNSLSMGVTAPGETRTRLAIARFAAQDLVLSASQTQCRVGVSVFSGPNVALGTGSSAVLSPLTNDHNGLVTSIGNIPQTSNGTFINNAFKDAYNMLSVSTATYKAVVILSDGNATDFSPDPDSGTALPPDSPWNALAALTNLGVIIISAGVFAANPGFQYLQEAATSGFFYNCSDLTTGVGAGNTCTTGACIEAAASSVSGKLCAGVVWGYAAANAPVPSSIFTDPEGTQPPTGGGANPTSWTATASYTASCAGTDSGDPVTNTASYTSSISQADAQAHANAAAQAAATAALSCCTNNVNITDLSNSVPFPACYKVSGFLGTVASVTVTLDGFTHSSPGDVYIIVEGPQGERVQLYAGNGGQGLSDGSFAGWANNVSLTFQDGGAALPVHDYLHVVTINSGTYAPSGSSLGCFTTPQFTPGSTGHALSAFNGLNPNGTWNLYVCDAQGGGTGRIDSWFVTFNGVAGCGCAGAPSSLSVSGGAGGALAGVTCPSAASSSQPAWDGTGIASTASPCIWTSGLLATTNSLNGVTLYSTELSLNTSNGYCYYELFIRTADSHGNPISTWRGWKSGGFGVGPAGVYDYVPLLQVVSTFGGGIVTRNVLCSAGPQSLILS